MSIVNYDYFWMFLYFAIAIFAGYLIHLIIFSILKRIVAVTPYTFDKYLVKHLKEPIRLLLIFLAVRATIPLLKFPIPTGTMNILHQTLYFFSLFITAWILVMLISMIEDFFIHRYQLDKKDNLFIPKAYSQFLVFKRLGVLIIIIVFISIALLSFKSVRSLGTGLLASIGIVGIVVGLAAQRIIGPLLAGIQIAFTQPIRIGDAVVVEKQMGQIEEINFTFVVVKLWDLRRLIVPTIYFLEQSFENWTRTSPDMLGTVFLYVDYHFPVNELRRELLAILEQSRWWNRKVWSLQVTDCRETTMELRTLMSANDSSAIWELRCEVREKLITYIQKNHPECLPHLRITTEPIKQLNLDRG